MDLPASQTAVERATKLFRSGLVRPALGVLNVELNNYPDQGELWLLRATILHSQANWAAALSAVETASTLIPLTLGGQLVLADCYSQTGKHELAVLAYGFLLQEESLPVDYYAGLYAGFKRAGKLEQAMAACRKAIKFAPENDEAYFGMAHCMSGLAHPPRAITSVLRKAVELAPEKPSYCISLVLQLSLTKRRSEAYRLLADRDPEIVDTVNCSCVARQLLELCAWAGDEQRCSRLGVVLARLHKKAQQLAAEGEDQA